MNKAKPVDILLVEDDPGHARLIVKNLKRSHITNRVEVLVDGMQALDYLHGEHRADLPPLLILLDLNLPRIDGYEVLRRIKADSRTKNIPVIVLTTTNDPQEVQRCYDLGCNVFVNKPVDYDQFSEAIGHLGLFLTIVTVPGS